MAAGIDHTQTRDSELDEINSRKFNTQVRSVRSLCDEISQEEIDMDPPHQRDEDVHSDAWKSEVIWSQLKGMPIGEPEFDTVRNPNGTTCLRSLDGKQRIMAIYGYIRGDYKYCHPDNKPKAMMKKSFEEIPAAWQQAIRKSSIAIKICESTLSDEEISYHFQKKQQSKKTTMGEHLKSMFSRPLIGFARKLLTNGNIPNLCNNVKRNNSLEVIIRVIYAIYELDRNRNSVNIDTSTKKLLKWVSECDVSWLTDEKKIKITEIISKTFEIVNRMENVGTTKKFSKTFYLPIVGLFVYYSTETQIINTDVSQFISNNLDDDDYYDVVGGNHNATPSRFTKVKEDFVSQYYN